ncbi:MAG TPA: hypothetical protein VN900_01770, partial [Stellaceae bacterium]|nr:hypothetical protein [Stellaceae bacterium]
MTSNSMNKGALRLPDLRFIARPIATALVLVRLRRNHALLASAAGIVIVAGAFTAIGYVRHAHGVSEAQIAASRVETANIDLQDELARLRDAVAASNRDLSAAQSRVVALTEEMHAHAQAQQPAPAAEPTTAPAKGDKATQLSQALHVAEAQRATLAARLSKAEADLAEQQAKQAELLGQIDQWQKKLEQLSSDRDRLKARVGELEKQSALRHAQQQVAAARPAPAAVATTAMAVPTPQPEAAAPERVAGVLNSAQPA